METEEEIIKRVGRQMFGESMVFTPQVMETAIKRYREIVAEMGGERSDLTAA